MQLKQVIFQSAWKSVYYYFKLLDERVQRNSHQLKHNDHVIELFALGLLQIQIPDYAHAQILAMTTSEYNYIIWLYRMFLR